jgi:hypothetical protein
LPRSSTSFLVAAWRFSPRVIVAFWPVVGRFGTGIPVKKDYHDSVAGIVEGKDKSETKSKFVSNARAVAHVEGVALQWTAISVTAAGIPALSDFSWIALGKANENDFPTTPASNSLSA